MSLRLDVIWKEAPEFAVGLGNTVWLCGVAMILSLILGALLVAPLTSRNRALKGMVQALVDAGRCVPFLLLTYIVYFALPALGIVLDKWTAALTTLVLYNAAYMAEILRAGWAGVPAGQTEAARAFGYSGLLLLWRIMFPQIWRRSIPLVINEMTLLIKASPAIAVIGVVDLTRKARQIAEATYEPLPAFVSAVIVYGVVLILLVVGGHLLERRFAGHGSA